VLVIFKQLKETFSSKHNAKTRCVAILDFAIFCVLGLFILLGQAVIDTCYFTKDLYSKKLLLKYRNNDSVGVVNFEETEELDPIFYRFFILFLKNYTNKQVETKVLIRALSESLEVSAQINKLIFSPQKEYSSVKMQL
jgi:hypothetical protein